MFPILMALLAGGLVLAAGVKEGTGSLGESGQDAAKKPARPKRRMNPQESFLEGEKVGRSKLEAELASKAAEEKKFDDAVAKRVKAAPPAAPKTEVDV